MAAEKTCAPVLRTKIGQAYVTDGGQEVPEHQLYRYDCACGERDHCGAAWYADQDRAEMVWKRRTEATETD